MVCKIVFLFSSAIFIQSISAQVIRALRDTGCLGATWSAPLAAEWPIGVGPTALPVSNGGGFTVTSLSPIAPTGLSIASENICDGVITIAGQVPFLSAAAVEGVLPSAGAGAITYGCGNGNVAMLSEDIGPAVDVLAFAGPAPYGPTGPVLGSYGSGCEALF